MTRFSNVVKFTEKTDFGIVLDVGNGVSIIGEGPVGTDDRGPILIFEKDGILFNGSEDQYNGTGGCVKNLKLFKKINNNGGTAIKLSATGPDRRCGETSLERLLIYGGNGGAVAGLWDYGIVVDGSMLTTPGAAGIRTTYIRDVRIAECREVGLWLKNAVHCKISGLQLDPGRAKSIKMKIDGGQNILADNLIINGNCEINGGKTIQLSGYIDTLILTDVNGIIFTGEVNNLIVNGNTYGKFYGLVNKTLSGQNTGKFKVL